MNYVSVSARPSTALAGVGVRLVSAIIDWFIVFVPIFIVTTVFSVGGIIASSASEEMVGLALVGGLISNLIALVITVGYYVYTWGTGTSVGMKAMGLRMVRADSGEAPGFGRAIVRFLVAYVSGIPLGLGYFWAIWDGQKQTWHDKAAGTIVVKV